MYDSDSEDEEPPQEPTTKPRHKRGAPSPLKSKKWRPQHQKRVSKQPDNFQPTMHYTPFDVSDGYEEVRLDEKPIGVPNWPSSVPLVPH